MPISFNEVGVIKGAQGGPDVLQNPTSLQFGPDGRLYVAEQNGSINALTIALQDGEYVATDHEELLLPGGDGIVKSIQNHNDDGTDNNSETNRQVTGLVVAGTAENPVLYLSSSDPRIGKNGETNLDTNSGVLTRATWTGTEWETVDLIRGLPRSEENHAVNGMVLDGDKLYLAVGGHTNNGAPSKFFSYTAEYALSGTVLEIDLTAVDALPTQTDPVGGQGGTPRDYKYDLPTLDDPNIANVTDGVGEDEFGMDEAGPWGGNDGLNMAILPADAPLRIYADGFRNNYDLAMTSDGKLYTVDNGSNSNLGAEPNTESGDTDGDGVSGEAINTPNNGGTGDPEPLFLIEEGGYYGHPAPVRANQNQAWTVYDNNGNPDTSLAVNTVADISDLVPNGVQIADGFLIDPSKFAGLEGLDPTVAGDLAQINARLFESGERIEFSSAASPKIVSVGSSTNGIVVYDSGGTAFDGVLDGKLFVTQFNDNVTLLNVNDAGDGLVPVMEAGADGIFGTADDVVQSGGGDGILEIANNNLGVPLANPLDVTVGPNGTLWVAEIGGNEITVLAPSDVLLPSNNDSDNDGILNIDDPFVRDANNGTEVTITPGETYLWDFDPNQDGNLPGPDGFGGGLTGVMINGTTDFEDFFQADSNLPGQIINLDNVKFITAAGGGTTVIEEVSGGDPSGGSNSGEFLFHTGVTLADNVGTATIKWSIFNPAGEITGDSQQIGGYIGTGDQSNYLKVVAIADGANTGIQVSLENNDAIAGGNTYTIPATDIFDAAAIPESAKIFIELVIDVINETATPTVVYETNSGDKTVVGTALSLTGTAVLDAVKGDFTVQGQDSGLAVGLFSSNTGESEANRFQAVFDDIEITATEAQLPPTAVDDTVSTGVNTVINIPVAQLLANDTDPNPADSLTVTNVANPQNGTVALNDNGTASDASDDFVVFTPFTDFVGTAAFDYTITDGTSNSTATIDVSVGDAIVLYRVNAGGPEVAALASDPVQLAWAANPGNEAQSGLGFANNTGRASTHSIANQNAPAARDASLPDYVPYQVFNHERWDRSSGPEMLWNFDVTAGATYEVNLFVRNGFDGTSEANERVFDIEIEGTEYFTDVDLSGTYGHQVAAMLTQTLTVTDDSLDIEFLHDAADNPLINAIEIVQLSGGVTPPKPVVSILNPEQSITEGDEGDEKLVFISMETNFTVPADETVDVNFTIEPLNGAVAGPNGDYEYVSTSAIFGGSTYIDTKSIAGSSSDLQIPIIVRGDNLEELAEAFKITINSVSPNATLGDASEATVTIVDDDNPGGGPGQVLFRINAGGAEVAANDGGPNWTADQALDTNGSAVAGAASPFLVDRGINGNSDNAAYGDNTPAGPGVNNTGAPDALFTTERFSDLANPNNIGYAFDVANGDYTVNLYFDELFYTTAGARIFDVEIEGVLVLDDFDSFATHGNDTGLQSFNVTVTDGELNLEFLKGAANNPHVAAIEIIAADGTTYTPPLDNLFGTSVEISDDRLNPTDAGTLSLGNNIVTATQEGENDGLNGVRDRDYFTFTVPDGQVLTGIFLEGFVNNNPTAVDGFLAIQLGDQLTVDPVTGAPDGAEGLLGAIVYGSGEVNQNLLELMAAGGEVGTGTGFSLPAFDSALTGDVTVWLNQGAGPGTPTLNFVTELDDDAVLDGAAVLEVTVDSNDVQVSNFGNNSFQLTNTGNKKITKLEIDVTNALYPDSVFDPFGLAGDTVKKQLTINTNGGTGVVSPDHGTATNPGTTYIGAGGIAGFEGIQILFDSNVNGGFEAGETLGFAVDMDPNSIAGSAKGPLDAGTDPGWDVGGISGAEIIGSTFTVTFEDGTTATGQLQGAGNQAGAQGLATQTPSGLSVDLTVNGLGAGGVGSYGDGGPSVIINGPAGETARVVLTKGIIQPVNNNFDEPYSSQLQAQLDALAASDFPANNAAEFQTVDVVLTGADQDISSLFDFTQVPGFDLVVDEAQVPLGFVASVIDPANEDLPISPVTAPIYLTFAEGNVVSISPGQDGGEPDVAGQFIVSLSAAVTSDTVVTYSVGGTATADSDYSALSGTVTINAGETLATITVPVLPDSEIEGDETVIVTLTGASGEVTLGGASQASIVITDDDVANAVSIVASQEGGEPTNPGEFTVSLAAVASQDTVISYSVGGTATAGSDYSALSGTVTIAAGATSATIAVPVLPDDDVEGDETVIVTLDAITAGDANVMLGATTAATVTITDDDVDAADEVVLYRVNAGGPEVAALASDPVQLAWAANTGGGDQSGLGFANNTGKTSTHSIANQNDPTARDASLPDYVPYQVFNQERWDASSGPEMLWNFEVTAGATYEVNLFVRNGFGGTSEADERIFDIEIEGTEYFTDIDLSGTYGHQVAAMLTQTLTVTDDSLDIEFLHDANNPLINAIEIVQINGDVTPVNTVAIAADTNAAEAGDITGQFLVSLSAAVASDTVVTYSVGGTATAGSDYSALSGTVTINAGQTSATITVPVLPDSEIEGDETVIVTLTGASGEVTLGGASQASIVIADDDVANAVSIVASQEGGEPTNPGEFTVSLAAVASQDTVISYSVGGTATAGSDYSALSGTVTINAGQTSATIAVPVLEDSESEGDETVVVTLDAITAGDADVVLGVVNEATVTIIDDEIIPETVTFEAEAADTLLGDYIGGVESLGGASGEQVLSFVKGASGESGSAVFNLDELTGTAEYDIVLGTYDENDGTASFTIFVNDTQVGELLLDQSLGSNVANAQTFITETVSFGVTLSSGDVLTVNAFEDADEHARLDFLQLVPVGSI